MVYEFTGNDSNTYTYGHRLLFSEEYKYILNVHGDVVALIDSEDEFVKSYSYDAFGNELNPSDNDTNPFRYCAEYFDTETGTIYLRARYYQPIVGRFSQRDTHWNTANMIYGDEVKTKEYKDYLGLNTYTVKLVDYAAVRQSGNVYGYCLNNPLVFIDPNGEVLFTVIGIGVAALFTVVLTGCSAQDRNEWIDNNEKTKLGYIFLINSYGYYGTASSGSYVRNISGGLDAAKAFFAQKTVGYVAEWRDGNALMREMDDGTIYTFREKSNSDGTPVVDINSKTSGLKSQKIHFVD